MNSKIVGKLSLLSSLLVVVLLPIFFLPFTNIPVEASKGLFLVLGAIISVIFWIVARFFDGEINIPKSASLLAGGVVVVAVFLSSIFGGASSVSLFGTLLDVGTFWFILAGFVLMLMAAISFRDPKNARLVLFGTILSSAVLLVFQFAHLFFPKVLSFGILNNNIDNVLGSWNALGIFAGFMVVASLFVIEFFKTPKQLKLILGALNVLALVMIAAVNFVFIWEILGVFAMLIFIYKISINSSKQKEEGAKIHFPMFSFGIVLVCLFFFMSSDIVGGILPTKLKILNNEVSPSLVSTMSVTKSVIAHNPIFGIGPNRFGDAWALYKPTQINGSQFWDFSFNSGFGLIPTFVATTGIIGLLAWLAFFAIFIFSGVKWLFFSIKNNINLETMSFFFLSLYLFVSSFFYFTGSVIFLLSMIFAGVFIGLVSSSRKDGEISISFLNDHRKTFIFMLALIIVMIVTAALGFKYIQRFLSIPYFTKTLSASKIEDAELNIKKALALNPNDLYFRAYSQVYLLKLNSIISKNSSDLSEADKAELQNSLDQAINGAQVAINYNPKNYLNYQALGSVFQTAGVIGVKDGYPKALETFQKASELNPANPRIKLILMNVSIALEKKKDAKEYANTALTLKPDYIEALVAMSQILKTEGNTAEAVSYAQKALALSPGNKDLINYVEKLKNGNSTAETPEINTTPQNN